MNTDNEAPVYKEKSNILIGGAMAVHNGVGYGFHEKPCENGLVVEFRHRKIVYEQQRTFDILYREENCNGSES